MVGLGDRVAECRGAGGGGRCGAGVLGKESDGGFEVGSIPSSFYDRITGDCLGSLNFQQNTPSIKIMLSCDPHVDLASLLLSTTLRLALPEPCRLPHNRDFVRETRHLQIGDDVILNLTVQPHLQKPNRRIRN